MRRPTTSRSTIVCPCGSGHSATLLDNGFNTTTVSVVCSDLGTLLFRKSAALDFETLSAPLVHVDALVVMR